MSAALIDLTGVRARRDAIVSQAHAYVTNLARFVVVEGMAHADRAFAVANHAHYTDPDLARDVYRAAHRRLRASLRRRLGRPVHSDVECQVLEQAERVFRARVWQLQDGRDQLAIGDAR